LNKQSSIQNRLWFAVVSAAVIIILYIISLHNYLLFHALVELFAIAVACGIFMLIWNARRFINNSCLLLLGVAYLFVGLIDLLHTLSYKGMNIFAVTGSNLATQLWISARYLESGSLLAGPLLIGRKLKAGWLLLGYTILTGLILAFIFWWDIFPVCFIEGQGLTAFKIASEYIICAILTMAVIVLWLKRESFDRRVLNYLIASIIIAILSELCFTLYTDVYGPANKIGHFLKLASFYMLYKAAIETGLREPYSVLLQNLQQSRDQIVREMEKTRNYLDVAAVIMVVIDSEEKVTLINRRGCEILGYPREDILGKNWFDNFVPERDRENIRDTFRKLIQEEIPATDYFENNVIDRNADERTIAWYHSLLLDAEGNISAILSSGEDVTQQKQDKEKILQQKELLESTIESLTHPFYVIDVNDFTVVTANSAARQYTEKYEGIKCHALTGGRCKPSSIEKESCPVNIVKRTKQPVTVEQNYYDKEGNERFSEIYAYPIFDNNENVKEVIEYCVDITERKLVEKKIESMAKFPSEDPNPVIRISKDGIILYANSAGTELLAQWGTKINEKAPQAWCQYVSRILASDSAETFELPYGQKVLSLTIAPVVSSGYVNVYGTDITERNQAEEDLRKYREHLEELVNERTHALGNTNKQLRWEIEQRKKLERQILNISEQEQRRIGQELHDSLGQQLTGISFMTQVLQKKLASKNIQEAGAVEEISKLVSEATNQARGLARGLHPVDLDPDSLLSSLAELASNTENLFGIKCTFGCDGPLNISKNETIVHLYRIAQEAVNNAIKHGNTQNIKIQIAHSDNNAVMTIENDGKDFPKNYGTHSPGIGLQIMNHRVDLINGKLKISKGSKEGTIVTCTFPLE